MLKSTFQHSRNHPPQHLQKFSQVSHPHAHLHTQPSIFSAHINAPFPTHLLWFHQQDPTIPTTVTFTAFPFHHLTLLHHLHTTDIQDFSYLLHHFFLKMAACSGLTHVFNKSPQWAWKLFISSNQSFLPNMYPRWVSKARLFSSISIGLIQAEEWSPPQFNDQLAHVPSLQDLHGESKECWCF